MKQIYASLQFGDDVIRLLVGEYFNTRFNIIKYEEVSCDGFRNFAIVNREKVKESLKKLFDNCSAMIGTSIESVILILPSYNVKRYALKVTLPTKNGYLSKEDVAHALDEVMKTPVDSDVTITNANIVRYIINGIPSRRLPEKDVCTEFSADVDLLCSDKSVAFEYVSLVEETGIKVMDICLDSYAIGKEAALFERAVNQNIILLNIDRYTTTLSLISKGKLFSCDILKMGMSDLYEPICSKYELPLSTVSRLVKYNTSYGNEYNEDAVFAWNKTDGESCALSEKDLSESVAPTLKAYTDKIALSCDPILKSGPTNVVVCGEGASMKSLINELHNRLDVKVSPYFPDTIGVRDSSLSALYGSFFVFYNRNMIYNEERSSVDLLELDNVVRRKSPDAEAETLTSKIKGLFEMNRNKEDKND